MKTIIVFQVGEQFYLPAANGMSPVSIGTLNAWRESGSEIEIREVEQYV